MEREHLAKLFGTVGLVNLFIAANTLIAGQGGKAIFSFSLLSEERSANALFGLVLVGALLILTACLGLLHAHRSEGPWDDRIPLVWLEKVKTASWDGRIYQASVVVLLLLLPACSLFKFGDTLANSILCLQDTRENATVSQAWWDGFRNPDKERHQLRLVSELKGDRALATFDPSASPICTGGIEIKGRWEFVAIMALDAASLLLALFFVMAVFWTGAFADLVTRNNAKDCAK